MKLRVTLSVFLIISLFAAAVATAGPIIKPRKYHGPIPRQSVSLRIGFLGGATNSEMFDYLETLVPQPVRDLTETNDFGNSPLAEVTYTYKLHPQFAVRGNFYTAFLRSNSKGVREASVELPDSVDVTPTVNYTNDVDVDLFTLELSALYYFTDAAVKEFQPYFGGGFSFGLPHQKFTETQVIRDPDSGGIWQPGETLRQIDKDTWTFEAGVHALAGALYYFGTRWAVSVEGRGQILQTSFPLEAKDEDGDLEEVKFVTNFSGFTLAAGISYAF